MKTTTNRSANSTNKGQSTDVLKGLNELKDLQRQSLSSMNQMISTMTSAVETFTQARTSRKRKRDEMSESESSDEEDLNDPGMAGNPPGDISSQVNDLLQSTESSKNCSKANEDEVLGELSKLYESKGTVSDPINAKLASLVDKMVKTSLFEEKVKEKHEKHNRPENCENLIIINTRVNPEIWTKVRSNTRSRDLKMQKLETSLLKSMIPIVKMSDKLLEFKSNSTSASQSDVCEFLQLSLDSLALMGHSINEVNIKRRKLIKPDLNDQFKQLCGSHTPITKLLFGDDLPKSVKEISETNKVGVKVASKPPTHYNKQQKRSNFHHGKHHQSQKPFLWKYQGPGKRSHQDSKKKGKPNQH